MNQIKSALKFLAVLTLAVLAAGCAAELQNKQNLAAAAGFKLITPTKPDQTAILATLPADKVTPIIYQGKSYYVLPDARNKQAYVGGQAEYQAYQQLRLQQQMSNDNLMAAQMNQNAAMNLNTWGGWSAAAPMGYRAGAVGYRGGAVGVRR